MATETEYAPVRTNVNRLISIGIALVAATAAGMTLWNKQQRDVDELSKTVTVQATSIETLQRDVNDVKIGMVRFQVNQEAQTDILKYLARDRRGPVPDAAK
jgi:hypothetical protein